LTVQRYCKSPKPPNINRVFYAKKSAMGTGTWQQQPSANGCQVPVPWQTYFDISLNLAITMP